MNPCILLDIETSGLDPKKDQILELAAVHFDLVKLEVFSCFNRAVYQPTLKGLDPWIEEHHGKSGLLELVRMPPGTSYFVKGGNSVLLPNTEALDTQFASWLLERGCAPGKDTSAYFVGNNVESFDKRFLEEAGMRKTLKLSSYRTINTRTEFELTKAWTGLEMPKTEIAHRALADCFSTLEGLRWCKTARGLT